LVGWLVGWQGSLIALLMEAAGTSETSVDIYFITRQYIAEDSEHDVCNVFIRPKVNHLVPNT
jgi:hypothetical protein